jgi:hypothetical protein
MPLPARLCFTALLQDVMSKAILQELTHVAYGRN